MEFEVKKLQEQLGAVANEMNQLTAVVRAEENRAFSPEELERFDRMDNDYKALSEKIETGKRLERSQEIIQPRQNKEVTSYKSQAQTITRNDCELAFKAWALKSVGEDSRLTTRHIEAAHKCNTNLSSKSKTITLADGLEDIERAQSSSIGSQGGYLQNDGTFQGLERNLKWFGSCRQFARVIRTDTGEPISFAYSDDTANLGYRQGQNVQVNNTSVTYQKKVLGENTYVTSVYPVSVQLLQDARIDVSSDVGFCLGQRLGRITNADFTNGTGAGGGPVGYMTEATLGVTAGGAAIAYIDLVKLLFSIDKAYRDDPSFAFVMSDSTLAALWQILDGGGRPLFWNQLNSLVDGGWLNIMGKKVIINNDMPSIATGKSPIAAIVGDRFVIRDVKETSILTLDQRYMDQLAVGFIAFLRCDCKLLNPNCCKLLKMP